MSDRTSRAKGTLHLPSGRVEAKPARDGAQPGEPIRLTAVVPRLAYGSRPSGHSLAVAPLAGASVAPTGECRQPARR